MIHWLHSLLPDVPHYGYVLVFIVVFLNNVGLPLPGETILLGAGFVLGQAAGSLWQPMAAGTVASFAGGVCAFSLGRRLDQGNSESIHWLHLTPERLKWPQRYFERHGAKAVFIARFIAILPPVMANVLAGMTRIPWRLFLLYNLTGSAAFTATYILIGYFFGRKWKLLEAWVGPATLYLIVAAVVLMIPGVMFRHTLTGLFRRLLSKKRKRR
jgi:membrane protein DedA with SNARE-associated domain